MTLLLIGLGLFIVPHLLRELGLRDSLLQRLGSPAYPAAYSLVALAGLVLIVLGKSSAPFVMIWTPFYELCYITHFLMLPAFILVAAGNLPMSHLRRHLRHPMLLGTLVWSLSHLWANGDLASILLFGGLGVWSAFKFVSMSRRPPGPTKAPVFTFDLLSVIIGCLLYALVAIYHGDLFNVGLSFD